MARLTREWKAMVPVNGEQVTFSFREATNKETNDFLNSRWPVSKGKAKDAAVEARCDFFDKLLTGVENLEDAEGNPVTPERKELIPANWKANIIFKKYEDDNIEIKN